MLAEVLARETAIARGGEPSFDGAVEATMAALTQAGIPTTGATMVDGSGLSSQDKVPAQLLGALLAAAAAPAQGPDDTEFLRPVLTGLPVAGGDGTLEDRFAPGEDSSAGRGVVRAKTGTLTTASSLAGVVVDADQRLLVFAFMSNGALPVHGPAPARRSCGRAVPVRLPLSARLRRRRGQRSELADIERPVAASGCRDKAGGGAGGAGIGADCVAWGRATLYPGHPARRRHGPPGRLGAGPAHRGAPRARPGRRSPATTRMELVARLRADAATAEGHVREVTGLGHGLPLLPADVVDRPAWAAAALSGMAALTAGAQLPDVGKAARAVTARTAGLQLGGVVAYLGGRVLGQYDPFGGPDGEGRLLLVAPNVHAAQQALDVSSADFGLWVCLHEATHRLQFTAVPWLRSYFADEVSRLLSLTGDSRPSLDRLPELFRTSCGSRRATRWPSSSCCRAPSSARCSTGCWRSPRCWRATPTTSWTRWARRSCRRWRRSGRGSRSAAAAGGWSTGSCARCWGGGEGAPVRRRLGVHQARRARRGDGRVQQGVGEPRDGPHPRRARRPRRLVAPGPQPDLTGESRVPTR